MEKITNCKNCGMPLVDGKCEYCGTVYYKHERQISSMVYANDRPFSARNIDGRIIRPLISDACGIAIWDENGLSVSGKEGVFRIDEKGISCERH